MGHQIHVEKIKIKIAQKFRGLYWPLSSCHGGDLVTKSCLTLATPWTVPRPGSSVHGFSQQGYWIGLPVPSPRDLSDPGIEPTSPACRQILYWLSHQGSPTPKEFPSPSHCFTLCHLLLCSPSFSYACLLCSCPESTKSQQTIVTKSTKFWSQLVGVKILPLLFLSNFLTFLCLSFFICKMKIIIVLTL